MFKTILLLLTLATAQAPAQQVYTDVKPAKEITKFEAMRKLLQSDNKAEIWECKQKTINTTKGTLINK